MALADLLTARVSRTPAAPGEKPRDEEVDLFGLTHRGKVRTENQDHFLLATVHPQVVVHGTNIPEPERLILRGQRLGTIMLVADGVGSGAGLEASRIAVETIARYMSTTLRCYDAAGSSHEEELLTELRGAALEAHTAVREGAAERQAAEPLKRGMATTLTLATVVYPWMYVVQVGDSRCYYYWDGELRQITRDQTVAQDLVDQGVLPKERAAASPFSHVLASAIGGQEASPVVSRIDISHRGCVILLCSDGLTKHVSDAEIGTEIGRMSSAEQVCRTLLDLALERGGSDNITVLVGTAPLTNRASEG
jgi:serine/threonine protein phosphatase PrpC